MDPVARAWEQGWKDVYNRLAPAEQSLLFEMLHASRNHQALPADKGTAAADLLAQLGTLWEDYQALAFQSVAELTGDDKSLWVDVLRQVNGRFANEVRPALQSVVDGRTATGAEERAIAGLQTTLDKLTTAKIEDDTVFRPAEREIWFRELARVRDADPAALRQQSVGPVAYLQLHKQPTDYRGDVVTVEGTVKLAYRVQAPENYLGITEYFVLWVHPAGGPNAPIVVYSLAVPPGFPAIKDKDQDRGTTTLHEDVIVTGVFFKRWAYPGKDGTYTAPLIVANVPTWTSTEQAVDLARQPLGPREYAAMVIAALVMSLCVTAVLWRRSRRVRPVAEAFGPGAPNLSALREAAIAPSPEETLRNLEREARRGST
jgi:hypothetical protein